jgi:hypothetical protein
MKTYKIAAMVTHSGKHLETEVAAYDIRDAFHFFSAYLLEQDLWITAICELDISEVVQ